MGHSAGTVGCFGPLVRLCISQTFNRADYTGREVQTGKKAVSLGLG